MAGWNSYAFVRNYAVSAYDLLGLWLSSSHEDFTVNAFIDFFAKYNSEMPTEMKEAILEYIVDANINTDSGEYRDNLYYHFNRGLNVSKEDAIKEYIRLQKKEIREFLQCLSNAKHGTCETKKAKCKEALEHLGRIAHMWQDYFAHGINPTKESNVGKIKGNPLRPDATPSSWNGFWDYKGEHGAVWTVLGHFGDFPSIEPGKRAPDCTHREEESEKATKVLFKNLFSTWIETCGCINDSEWLEDSLWETLKSWF